MDYCLPPKFANAFLAALRDGTITPQKLASMSSADRRAMFKDIIGEDNAKEVNALYEKTLLLKDQQRGLINWAKSVGGLSEARKADLVDKITGMSKVLDPDDQHEFLADLAATKLGVTVTADEAKQILDAAKAADELKQKWAASKSVDDRVAYGRAVMALNEQVRSFKPHYRSIEDRVLDVMNLPKSALTSILHMSALGVQAWGMISTARAWEAVPEMFKFFADEDNYKNLTAYMITHPDYELAMDGKLGITRLGDALNAREEAILSSLVERANTAISAKTGLPNLVRASSRAFTGYLNYVRFNRFTDLLEAARLNGEDVSKGSSVVRNIASVVNDFTGRSNLGTNDVYANASPVLNALFFAPRKIGATINMFNPQRYLDPRISGTARMAAARQLGGSLLATGAVLMLARAMGADVDFDPRSQNFAKIQIGGEKFDITGGNAIYLRLLARIASNKDITAKGKMLELGEGYKPTTRADLAIQYTVGKLSPVAGIVADGLYGHDPVGRPFSVTQEAQDKLIPIVIKNYIDFFQNNPDHLTAAIPSLAGLFGVGMESPLHFPGEHTRDVWGEPATDHPVSDTVTQTLSRIGVSPGYAPKKIRGVTLTPEQYDRFQDLSGHMMKQAVANVVNSVPGFENMPLGIQEELVRKAWTNARDNAANRAMMEYQGTANDIVAQAPKVKEDLRMNGSFAARKVRASK